MKSFANERNPMKSWLCAVCAWLVCCAAADASVGGQSFAGSITDFAGTASLKLKFIDDASKGDSGLCEVKLNGKGPYDSSYDAPPASTVTQAEIIALSLDDAYYVRYTVVSIDLKQARGLLGRVSSQLRIPAVMYGFGFSTTGAKGVLVATEVQ